MFSENWKKNIRFMGENNMTFENLGINQYLIEKLKERSIETPTAIQSLVIPELLAGKNILFRSATGTGKTFAYLLPALQRLSSCDKDTGYRGLAVLICAPTLELCSQIKAEVEFLTTLPTALLTGSVMLDRQIENLKKTKPVIAVGNPGRLVILAKMGKLKFTNLQFVVFDEADRLTVNECLDETTELLAVIEREIKRRQEGSGLCLAACSATVGRKVCTQLGPMFGNAEIVESDDHEILRERIEHWAIFSERRRKVQTLRSLLAALKGKKSHIKALVFTSRGDEAGKILSQLQHHSIMAAGLFGKLNKKPQTNIERKAALDSFRKGAVDVLISTDLAARGLDIPNITHVIALDVPSGGDQYVHRCGRTGRAGRRGIMITIGDETQMHLLASMEKKLKIKVNPKELYEGKVCVPMQS
jgi:superfamily II DNA/RNA helicase